MSIDLGLVVLRSATILRSIYFRRSTPSLVFTRERSHPYKVRFFAGVISRLSQRRSRAMRRSKFLRQLFGFRRSVPSQRLLTGGLMVSIALVLKGNSRYSFGVTNR